MQKFLSIILIFVVSGSLAQKISSRSKYERRWALAHPFAAIKVKRIYKDCLSYYEEIKKNRTLDPYENGGKTDAFRHAFFMAAFTQKINERKLRKLGEAHEKGNYQNFLRSIKEDGELADSLSSVMDLHNNEIGFRIGRSNKQVALGELKNIVIDHIKKGEALYFKRNSNGQYLTCEGSVIILLNFKEKWAVPKCLVKTDL